MQHLISRVPKAALILVAVLAVWGVWPVRRAASSPGAPSGGVTALQRILDRTAALLPLLNASSPSTSYRAEFYTVYMHRRRPRHLWVVDGLSASKAGTASCCWDADTGDLVSATCAARAETPGRAEPPISHPVYVGLDWIGSLGLQAGQRVWTARDAPRYLKGNWVAVYRSGSQVAVVRFAQGGRLDSVEIYQA